GMDPVAHFAYRGWREGRSPRPEDDLSRYLQRYPQAVAALVNPVLAHIEATQGAYSPAESLPPSTGSTTGSVPTRDFDDGDNHTNTNPSPNDDADKITTVRVAFSPEYYLAQYPDVAAAGVDPVVHYYYDGWREGRNPTKDFDTSYYLEANEDVAIAGVNP